MAAFVCWQPAGVTGPPAMYMQFLSRSSVSAEELLLARRTSSAGYNLTLVTHFDTLRFVRDTLRNTLTLVDKNPLFLRKTFRCRVESNTYLVHCFVQPMPAIDAGNVFYWCEPFGLLFFHSRYWPVYGLVQNTQNQQLNRLTWLLAKAVYPQLKEDCRVYFSAAVKPGKEHVYTGEWDFIPIHSRFR